MRAGGWRGVASQQEQTSLRNKALNRQLCDLKYIFDVKAYMSGWSFGNDDRIAASDCSWSMTAFSLFPCDSCSNA